MQLPIIMNLLRTRMITTSGCWHWLGKKDKDGYGTYQYNSIRHRVHVLSAKLYNIYIDSLWVLHTCNKKSCFNPSHIYAGTPQENTRDCINAGTHRTCNITHCPRGHEYNTKNTYKHKGKKYCKKCHAISAMIRRAI